MVRPSSRLDTFNSFDQLAVPAPVRRMRFCPFLCPTKKFYRTETCFRSRSWRGVGEGERNREESCVEGSRGWRAKGDYRVASGRVAGESAASGLGTRWWISGVRAFGERSTGLFATESTEEKPSIREDVGASHRLARTHSKGRLRTDSKGRLRKYGSDVRGQLDKSPLRFDLTCCFS